MSCFDEEPDAPLHGECELEINMLLQTIERLRHEVNAHRNAAMEADLRTQAAVRGEKAALANKVNISELRRIMTEWHQQARELGFDGVPDLIADVQRALKSSFDEQKKQWHGTGPNQ